MRSLPLRIVLILSAAVALSDTSCSGHARIARAMARADEYFAATRYDAAEIEYKNVLQRDPRNARAIGQLGAIYRLQGRTAAAVPFLTKAKELQPDDLGIRTNLALALAAGGALTAARTEALAVIAREPANADALLILAETSRTPEDVAAAKARIAALPKPLAPATLVALAELEIRVGRAGVAETYLEEATRRAPTSAEAFGALGLIYWGRKDLAAADAALKRASELSPVRSPRRLQYAQFKQQTGQADTARTLLDDIARQAPDFVPAALARAELLLAERNFDGAAQALAAAIARDTVNPDLLMLQGRIALARGDIDDAIKVLGKLTALYTRLPTGAYWLGNAYAAKGENARAAEQFNRAVSLAPDYIPAIVALAELNERRGSFGAAAAALEPLVKDHPDLLPAALLLAHSYRAQGKLPEAVAIYRRIETRFPQNAEAPLLRGIVLRQQGQIAAATAAFERAVELAPADIAPVQQLVELDAGTKAFDRATARIEAARQRMPKSAEPDVLLARVRVTTGDLPGAIATLERGIALEPANTVAYTLLAQVYIASNQHEKALARLQELATRNPRDTVALTLIAVLQDSMKQPAAAKAAYERVLAVAPKSVVALNNLAYLYAQDPARLERAQTLAEQARTLAPDDPRTLDTLGWVLYQRGKYSEAAALLRESATKLPDEPEAQFHLGMAYYMVGDEPAARTALQRATQGHAVFEGSADALHRLALLSTDPENLTPAEHTLLRQSAQASAPDPVALTRLAVVYQHEGKLDAAYDAAQRAREISPRNAAAWSRLARIHQAKGDRSRALDAARTAHTLAPDDAAITHLLGRLAYDDRQYRWAASLLTEAAAKTPADAELLYDSARAAYSIGAVADAQAAAQRAIELADGAPWLSEARRFVELTTFTAATASPDRQARINDLLKTEPEDVPASMVKAALAAQAGDTKVAVQYYERVLGQFPDFAPAQKELVLLYARTLENAGKAARLAAKARETYPGDAELAKAYGIIVYRQGDYARAATLLRSSAAERQNDGELLYYLGMTEYRLKQSPAYKNTLRRALDLGVPQRLAPEAKRTLATDG